MEIVIVMFLFVISIEGALILYNMREKKEEKKEVNPRREVKGIFRDPLGDSYRKNSSGLYRPVRPNRGEEDEDEV